MPQLKVPELAPLLAKLRELIAAHIAKNDLPAGRSELIQHRVTSDFTYGDTGVEAKGGLTGRPVAKVDWGYAGGIVTKELLGCPEFTAATGALARFVASSTEAQTHASNLIYIFAPKLIGGELGSEEELVSQVNEFLNAISKAPSQYTAKVELTGIYLRSPEIQLPGILLRQTRREDLEKDVSIFSRRTEAVGHPYPGMIAEISMLGMPNEIHQTVRRLVTMLRLFAVASVNFSVYWYSVGSANAAHFPGSHTVPLETALVRMEDETRLRNFWSLLSPRLPSHLYDPANSKKVDYLLVAYERYNAALLRRDIFEERVANAVMGLEALLLVEKQEVSFRCRLRVARALSFLHESPREVFDRLGYAYEARNSFAHGDRLSARQERKLEAAFPDREIVFRSAAGYLRKALVASILNATNKKALISLLDDALVDPSTEKNAAVFFASAAEVV